jgi:soluble lytic murein transglycosylase-like protein
MQILLRPVPALIVGILSWSTAPAAPDAAFQEAYQSKDPHMLTAWGRRYESGVGAPKDASKALRLYCKAAKKGDAEAQYQLGQMYAFGRGVKQDKELAAAWFHKASSKHAKAGSLLKLLKADGRPKRRATCPLGDGGTRLASRAHPASGEIAGLVRSLAPRYRLDPNLVLAVVEAESNFNPQAKSHKNAQGLMQLIPATAERFGVQDVWDPEQNLRGGMAYLRWLLDHFDGDVKLALAGYNAGERAVERHGGVPPYKETQSYVKRIMRRLGADPALESS